ncbi:unnamed protein product [Dicrocoelium dendriticum]|nr:unnamed protein product [Dicrocoelium dendriticum]
MADPLTVGTNSISTTTCASSLLVTKALSCMYTNAQGLISKLVELRHRLASEPRDIIMITETWLSGEITDAEIAIPGMSLLRNDRTGKGGGVLIYFRTNLRCELIDDPQTCVTDVLWCKLWLERNDVCLLSVVYRPPKSTPERDNRLISAFRSVLNQKYSHILVAGDFNTHDLENPASETEVFKAYLQELLSSTFLYNHVTVPTRFRTGNNPSILDLVLTNEELMVDGLKVCSPLGRSDHVTLQFDYICYAKYPAAELETRQSVIHYHVLSALVENTSWTFLANCTPELAWETFANTITSLVIEASTPKVSQHPRTAKSFLRSRTRKCMTLRDRAWRTYKSNPSAENWTEYVSHRNYCVLLVREDKRTHQQELAKRFCSNKKLLYKHVNGLRKVQRGIPPLNTTNGYTHTAKEAANALRAQYSPIFQGVQASTYIPPLVTPPPVLSNVTFTAEMVLQKLLSLRPHSSPGADNIHPKTLQVAAIHLAEPLAAFFQRCFDENIVPSRWKQGVITPIYKAGSRSDPVNYRPVTLLPVIAKVMEAVIADALMGYLENYGIIAPEQHGFRQHRSCTTNLLIARDNWTETVDEGTGVDVAFLDFSKAFDRLDHRILLIKLQQYGIGDPLLGWIGNFLSERQLVVRVRSSFSDPIRVGCGVPQGSVLGPRLFLLFINDLVRVITSKFLLFADDLKVWRAIKRSDDHEVLQRDLNEAWNWSVRNALPFNVDKCRVVHIRHRQVHVYKLGAHDLKTTTQERDLGVLVQEDLGCSKQSDSASKRGNQHVGLLRRAFGILDPSIFSLMLNAYVRPHVEYAIQAWQPWLKRDLAALETPQRRATKIVKGLRHTPYQERLEILGVFSGRYRRLRGDLILVYQILSDPSHVCRHLLKLSPNTNLRGNSLKLSQQYSRLDCRKTYFSLRVCGPWNALPNSVVCAPTLDTFKKRLDVALSALRFVL